MDERTSELLAKLVSSGKFPNMSASEGHELYDGIIKELTRLDNLIFLLKEKISRCIYVLKDTIGTI